MDRCALFVDAGYALADGAMAVHGTRRRGSVSWDHAGLLKLLAGLARDRTGLPVLRCYWYESAEGGRTAEHDALAEMPGLKLRLVNTRPGSREGIESQLRRDVVTLAKGGAIADAFIASADEHLAEIVAEVQDLGLRIVVLHIASDGGWTIPQPLRQECDDIVEISGVHLRPFVDLIRGAEPAAPQEQYAAAGYGSRSLADDDVLMSAAMSRAGTPAQALPAPVAAYQAPAGSDDYGRAQPYANGGDVLANSAAYDSAGAAGSSRAADQALMAARRAETAGGGSGQFGGPYQNGTGGGVHGAGLSVGSRADGLPQAGDGRTGGQQPGYPQAGGYSQALSTSVGGSDGLASGQGQGGAVTAGQRETHGGPGQRETHGGPRPQAAQGGGERLAHGGTGQHVVQAGAGQFSPLGASASQHGGASEVADGPQFAGAAPQAGVHPGVPQQAGQLRHNGAEGGTGQHVLPGQGLYAAHGTVVPQHAPDGNSAQHPAHVLGGSAQANAAVGANDGNAGPAGAGAGYPASARGTGTGYPDSAPGTGAGRPDSVATGIHAHSGGYQNGVLQQGFGQQEHGQPGRGQPEIPQDGTAQNGTGQHGTVQHGGRQHSTGQHSTGQHNAGQHNAGQHGMGQYQAGQHGTGQHGTGQYGAGPQGAGQAGTGPNGAGPGSYQGSGCQDRSYQDRSYQDRSYQDSGRQDTGYQDSGRQDSGRQDSSRQDTGYQDTGYQGAPAASGPGQPSAVHHLSGLSFPPGSAASVQNGYPGGQAGNGATGTNGFHTGYQNGVGQNGTGVHAAADHQNGSAQSGPGQFGSFNGFQAGIQNGSPVNPGVANGGPVNPPVNPPANHGANGRLANGSWAGASGAGGNGAGGNRAGGNRASLNPAGFEAAPVSAQPSISGPIDPGYFGGQSGPGEQTAAHRSSSQHSMPGAHGPSFQPHPPHQAQPYEAQPYEAQPYQAQPYQAQPPLAQPSSALPVLRAPQPLAISLPEAVKAAHSEGFTFGESVGRDAPGLWLEAVLARKPRMPSDLEARLLQGSVLPIDSLLHDEVRHSLRRGFWDALESARR